MKWRAQDGLIWGENRGIEAPLAAKAPASGLQSQSRTQENVRQPLGVSAPKGTAGTKNSWHLRLLLSKIPWASPASQRLCNVADTIWTHGRKPDLK